MSIIRMIILLFISKCFFHTLSEHTYLFVFMLIACWYSCQFCLNLYLLAAINSRFLVESNSSDNNQIVIVFILINIIVYGTLLFRISIFNIDNKHLLTVATSRKLSVTARAIVGVILRCIRRLLTLSEEGILFMGSGDIPAAFRTEKGVNRLLYRASVPPCMNMPMPVSQSPIGRLILNRGIGGLCWIRFHCYQNYRYEIRRDPSDSQWYCILVQSDWLAQRD